MTAPILVTRESPASPDGEYVLAENVALLVVPEGGGVLVDLATNFFAISEEGAAMLKETLASGADVAARRVASAFGAAPEKVRDDLRGFLADLERRGLVVRRGAERPTRRVARAAMALATTLEAMPRFPLPVRAGLALALGKLCVRLFGLPATVAAWRRSTRRARALDGADDIDRAVRRAATKHPLRVDCKEVALSSWALARAAGLHATLVVGVELHPLSGHCWCEVDGRVLGEDPGTSRNYTPIFRVA